MNRIYLVSIHVQGSSWNLLSLVSTSRYSFVELWKLAQASTDFYPLALYVHEGRLFGTGVRLSLSLSRSPSSATLALLRSAVRRDRFIPEIYFLLKRSRKRLVGVSVPFSLSPRPSFTIQSSVRCSLKNEFAPATRRVREQRGRPLSRNARSYYFTWTLAHEAHTLKLYEAAFSSFRHFFPTFFVRWSSTTRPPSESNILASKILDFVINFDFSWEMCIKFMLIRFRWNFLVHE